MRTKHFILTVALLLVGVLSVADNVITVIGRNGEPLMRIDASQVDSITLNRSLESYGNYAYDFDGHFFSGTVETYKGLLSSGLMLSSSGYNIKLMNLDPYFYYFGYIAEYGYNEVVCSSSEWVGDTLYLYAPGDQSMNYDYDDVRFVSYTGYLNDNYEEELVFAITDGGQTFTYVNGLVLETQDAYYNFIEPGTSIVADSLAEASAARSPQRTGLSGRKLQPAPMAYQPKGGANVKAAGGASNGQTAPSAVGKDVKTAAGGSTKVDKAGHNGARQLKEPRAAMTDNDIIVKTTNE